MALAFTLLNSVPCRPRAWSSADLEHLAAFVLRAERLRGDAELTLDLTGPGRIQALNRRFRGVDRPTDVISFRYGEFASPPDPLPSNLCSRSRLGHRSGDASDRWSRRERERRSPGVGLQGDIAINVAQAARQAREVGHPLAREIRLLWIHGILHLLGYTDYRPAPRRRMFRRQNQLLRRWEVLQSIGGKKR